ncbi:MAG: ABC transporter ATP-binding protein [Acidimicrobiia bacterium]|nr:ABC transporter ATP-binding protein [Acidimicrobiia bacterium]
MLTVHDLRKTYTTAEGPVLACDGLGFEVARGEILSLVGPSGCGKTSALRCVAGLETPDSGLISLGGIALYDSDRKVEVAAHRRPVGMVFQSYAIWPHMTVGQNVAYPLTVLPRRRRPNRSEIAEQVRAALERVRIGELADRPASALSGGQQQRVAIARALLRGAELLLFDEPLSNLDAKLREEMRGELRALFQHAEVGVLYVTHDLAEALALSDRLLVLQSGRIVQAGVPEDIYRRPATEFVAGFLGNANLLPGRVMVQRADNVLVDSDLGRFELATTDGEALEGELTLLVRPEGVEVVPLSPATRHLPQATVEASMFLGSTVEYRVRVGDRPIRACTATNGHRFDVDTTVALSVRGEAVVPVGADAVVEQPSTAGGEDSHEPVSSPDPVPA